MVIDQIGCWWFPATAKRKLMAGPALALGEPAQEHGAFIQGLCYQQEGNSGAIVPILRARPAFCPPVLLVAPSAALGEITNKQHSVVRPPAKLEVLGSCFSLT